MVTPVKLFQSIESMSNVYHTLAFPKQRHLTTIVDFPEKKKTLQSSIFRLGGFSSLRWIPGGEPHLYLVGGGQPSPLKNDGVKVSDDDIPNWKNKKMFQTTNQFILLFERFYTHLC